MWNRIKKALASGIFAEEYKDIAKQKAVLESIQRKIKEEHKITSLVRNTLGGFDPKLLDTEDDLPEVLGEVEAQDVFLAGMKRLKEDKHLWLLVDYLTRNQIIHAVKEAQTLDTINFARATINGWSLLREEVDRLTSVYVDRHPTNKLTFDEHEVV